MALESLEYKKLLHAFGRGLRRVDEELWELAGGEVVVEGAERERIVADGRARLAAWEALVARLDEGERLVATEDFGERVGSIEASLARIVER